MTDIMDKLQEVVMNWHDDALGRMKYLYADDAVFDDVPLWRRHFFNDYAQEGAAYLAISASDPENLKGVDGSRIIRAQQASGKALKEGAQVVLGANDQYIGLCRRHWMAGDLGPDFHMEDL